MSYKQIVEQFLYSGLPTNTASKAARFEAIVAELIGTKQRRNGPMPSPEIQVEIRKIVRDVNRVTIFMPWGARKQNPGSKFDILDFMAIKQLRCMRMALLDFNFDIDFVIRIEDLTDLHLFRHEDGNSQQIEDYVSVLSSMLLHHLNATVLLESSLMGRTQFEDKVQRLTPSFQEYLRGIGELPEGWKPMNSDQFNYFQNLYAKLMPGRDPIYEMAKYFAAIVTRNSLRGTGRPDEPHLLATFSNPIPGDPVQNNRLYYRTLPQRYTHVHRAPWLSDGYLEIDDMSNAATPRFADKNMDLIDCRVTWEGYEIDARYKVN